MCIDVHLSVCTGAYRRAHACAHACAYMYECTPARTHAVMHVCADAWMGEVCMVGFADGLWRGVHQCVNMLHTIPVAV